MPSLISAAVRSGRLAPRVWLLRRSQSGSGGSLAGRHIVDSARSPASRYARCDPRSPDSVCPNPKAFSVASDGDRVGDILRRRCSRNRRQSGLRGSSRIGYSCPGRSRRSKILAQASCSGSAADAAKVVAIIGFSGLKVFRPCQILNPGCRASPMAPMCFQRWI